jgi:hypothetical protein
VARRREPSTWAYPRRSRYFVVIPSQWHSPPENSGSGVCPGGYSCSQCRAHRLVWRECGGSPVLHGTPVDSFRTRQASIKRVNPLSIVRQISQEPHWWSIMIHSVAHPGPSWHLRTATRMLQSPVWYCTSGMTCSGQVPKISSKRAAYGSVSVPRIRIFNSPAFQTLCGMDAHFFLWGFLLGSGFGGFS